MSTPANSVELANDHDATDLPARTEFFQQDMVWLERQFLYQILTEHSNANRELKQIEATLRSLAPGFSRIDRLAHKVFGKKDNAIFRTLSGNNVLSKAFNALITICGFVFFKTRLADGFNYITEDFDCGMLAGKEQRDFPHSELVEEIARSGLFDSSYYLSQAPSALHYKNGPIAHYIECGRELNPHRLFDVRHFFASNAGLSPCPTIPPLLQFIRSTKRESYSPHPLFDACHYVDCNPHLEAIGPSINPLVHYLTYGQRQGRDPHPLFFNGYYMNQYGEQVRASLMSPLEHFIVWGCTGNFNPNEIFDCHYYLSQRPNLRAAFVNPLLHYIVADENSRACPHPLFDADYYLSQICDRDVARLNPLAHFLHSEVGKRSSPHPLFDIDYYLTEYPHIAEENFHAFIHYMRMGESAGYNPNRYFFTDWFKHRYSNLVSLDANSLEYFVQLPLKDRPSTHPFFDPDVYIEQNGELRDCEVDPLTHYLTNGKKQDALFVKEPTFNVFARREQDRLADTSMDIAYRRLMELAREPFSILFLIPGLVKGGAERAACNFIQYLQERHGKDQVLILFTLYEEHTCMDWLPEGSRYIDLAKISSELEWEDKGFLIASFLVAKRPEVTHTINSNHFLHTLGPNRDVLERCSRFVVYLFGYDAYLPDGPSPLTIPLFYRSIGWIDCLITDNRKMLDLVVTCFPERELLEKKTECCYNASQSIDQLLEDENSEGQYDGKKILWASRLVETKKPDLLVQLARRLPHLQFVVYGSAETGGEDSVDYLRQFNEISNIDYRGEYAGFSAIDKSDIGVFVYTTSSDGIPIVLLEAAACRLPTVAPRVGGIPEFVSNETGWLVEKFDDIEAYCRCIEECLANRQTAAQRAERAWLLVKGRHSRKAFSERLKDLKEFF